MTIRRASVILPCRGLDDLPTHLAGPGAADLLMAWVSVPGLTVHASPQRYEHVRAVMGGGAVVRYLDRGAHDGFTADLVLDSHGLAETYPGLAERVR